MLIEWCNSSAAQFKRYFMSIKIGNPAPDFTLPSQNGEKISLSQFKGKKNVVLFFYHKDNTAICTKEACSFRDSYEIFKKESAEVIGVSRDDIASHKNFAGQYKLPFILLSDVNANVHKTYDVMSGFGLIPGRVTFVIDKKGIVRHSFSGILKSSEHIEESLKILKTLVL